jgi:hypothetical protein
MLAGLLIGCQVLLGIEVRDEAPPTAAGGSQELGWCDPLPTSSAADFSCAGEPSSTHPDSYRMGGQLWFLFPAGQQIVRFESCMTPLQTADAGSPGCTDRSLSSCMEDDTIYFQFTAAWLEHAELQWSTPNGVESATFWAALSQRNVVDVGTAPLFAWSELVSYAQSVGVDQPDESGMLFLSTKDCQGRIAAGVYVRAMRQGDPTGVPFALYQSAPRIDAPSNTDGLAGVLAVDPGWVTVQAYLEGGCLVAEADVYVRAREITYVSMIPAGTDVDREPDPGCLPGPGGAGGGGS